jgi:hypothetical protein
VIGVSLKLKDFFFDRPQIKRIVRERGMDFLGNAGGYLRKTAIRSMRRSPMRGKPSKPGAPPRFRSGNEDVSLRKILYGLDPARMSVVVGPLRFNQRQDIDGMKLVAGTVPSLHERGGVAGIREKFKPFDRAGAVRAFGEARAKQYGQQFGYVSEATWRRIYGPGEFAHRVDRRLGGIWVGQGRGRGDRFLIRTRQATYPARPFMRPAAEKTQKRFPKLWFSASGGEG